MAESDVKQRVSIVGAGMVGSALAFGLAEAGYAIASVVSRTKKHAEKLASAVDCRVASVAFRDIAEDTEVLVVSTGDDALPFVAEEIAAQSRLSRPFAFHTSGVHTSSALAPLARRGALVASIHPVQTFPGGHKPDRLRHKLRGIYYGIEGPDASLPRAEKIVYDLGGRSTVIPPELKPLYHLTCVFASNYLTVFLHNIQSLSAKLPLTAPWHEVFGPLMMTTLENTVKSTPEAALTGPVSRGDFQTVKTHVATIRESSPDLALLYAASGIQAAHLALQSGRLSDEEHRRFVQTFETIIHSSLPKEAL
jgi:predicted short-subunit dehydrogenase-like oxidoreductase (DUF2520 family)